jgi:hypothetical protein
MVCVGDGHVYTGKRAVSLRFGLFRDKSYGAPLRPNCTFVVKFQY